MKLNLLHNIYVIIIVSLVVSCHNSSQKIIEEPTVASLPDTESYKLEQKEIDKLYIIEDKAVIFFLLSSKELNKLTKELGNSYRYETDFLFSNFTQQVKEFKKILAKHNIKSELVRNKKILIKLKNGQTVNFNRIHEDQIMGEIISDGIQDPVIEYGMFRNKELAKLIENYFKIENLGIIEKENKPLELTEKEEIITDSIESIPN